MTVTRCTALRGGKVNGFLCTPNVISPVIIADPSSFLRALRPEIAVRAYVGLKKATEVYGQETSGAERNRRRVKSPEGLVGDAWSTWDNLDWSISILDQQ
ncbi:hypothetical protein KM043_017208 [Ampulex compressa]|nr:hypothetical protein KM043_017208 [Ampulex compressa]